MFRKEEWLAPDGQHKGVEQAFTEYAEVRQVDGEADGSSFFVFLMVAEIIGDIKHTLKPGEVGL